MHSTRLAILILGLSGAAISLDVKASSPDGHKIVISADSVQVDRIEVRCGPQVGATRYFSLCAAEKALGPFSNAYIVGLGVQDYAWTPFGIHLQRGFRGADKNMLFKFQVCFVDVYDKRNDKNSGRFDGEVIVDGMAIGPDTTFGSMRTKLEAKGYKVTAEAAEKGGIRVLKDDATNKVVRVEEWCGINFPVPNQAMQPTTGRRTIKFPMTPTSLPATTRALASGG